MRHSGYLSPKKAPESSKGPGAGLAELLELINMILPGGGDFSLPREAFTISKIT
jgi:hypothetical protein